MSDELKPHSYSPDYQAMGDCRVCGHVQDSWPHWPECARAALAQAEAERDAAFQRAAAEVLDWQGRVVMGTTYANAVHDETLSRIAAAIRALTPAQGGNDDHQ